MAEEPDLESLRALTLAAQHGSISAAAAQQDVSQQALSLRIRALERRLGLALLVRSPRGSHLTPSGELLVGWAAPLLAAADEFAAATRSLRESRADTLRIAASLTIAEHLLPPWVARWRAQRGQEGPLVQLRAANSSAVVESVREGAADLGFIETPDLPQDLGREQIGSDTVEVVVDAAHPWARRPAVGADELAWTPLVLREPGSGTRRALEEALLRAGHPLTAEPAVVSPTTLGVRGATMAGTAPGALSSIAVAEDLRAGRLVRVPVEGLAIPRPLSAIWSGRRPSAAARAFLSMRTLSTS
ncbi:LysR family transcriptional regulator [Kocuria palustris]|uniref:LysR family transcriptional regulator n=1 Tax=Kocuria palustris TaxID=71999 RepID=UPI0019593523|nr:LysR family transcriptional regulator [Kocuria palustris]MBM7823433.1 DNA-binding transcriptional LysR family regulator [Kocuria palustris]